MVRVGSILWLSLQEGEPPRALRGDPSGGGRRLYAALHRGLLERGVYLAPSAYEVAFVSLAHDEAVIDRTVEAFDAVVGGM